MVQERQTWVRVLEGSEDWVKEPGLSQKAVRRVRRSVVLVWFPDLYTRIWVKSFVFQMIPGSR